MIRRIAALPQFKVLLATVVCAFAFLILLFVFDFPIWLSVTLDAVLYLALHLLLTTVDPSVRLYAQLLRDAKRKLALLRELAKQINRRAVRDHVQEIIAITERVVKFTEKKAVQLPAVRQMLTFYLDSTVQIVTAYSETSSLDGTDGDGSGRDFTAKVEESLSAIRQHFQSQYESLLRNDLSDLTAKMDALKDMLEWEGLR